MVSNSFSSEIVSTRFISKKFVSFDAPTVILLLGMHGNEVAGIQAARRVLDAIEVTNKWQDFTGNFYVIKANVNAVEKGIRYEDVDLNRLWSPEQLEALRSKEAQNLNAEEQEQKELKSVLDSILNAHKGRVYFADMHTTSSPTTPFIVHVDAEANREFSSHFSTRVVLGIEDFIKGTLFDYIDEKVDASIVFEAGQHQAESSVRDSELFIWKLLEVSKIVSRKTIDNIAGTEGDNEQTQTDANSVFRIVYKYQIQAGHKFEMKKGYVNFQKIKKGELLAWDNSEEVTAKEEAFIFMPLYQTKGSDGFFTITSL